MPDWASEQTKLEKQMNKCETVDTAHFLDCIMGRVVEDKAESKGPAPDIYKPAYRAEEDELKTEWEEWSRKVKEQSRANIRDSVRNDPSLKDDVKTNNRFSVKFNRDGHIDDLEMTERSGSDKFDSASQEAIEHLEFLDVLDFPANSQRQSQEMKFGFRVEKGRRSKVAADDVETTF